MTRQGREARSYIAPWFNIVDLSQSSDGSHDSQIPPPGHIPCSSSDTALTAFAQLSAIRLRASRSLISLIDQDRQYVLAEATQSLSLQSDTKHDDADALWLGSAIIPRNRGVCEHVLVSDADAAAVVIKDLQQDERFCDRPYVKGHPRSRFYAGVPLRSPLGFKIGVLCIFDNAPRDAIEAGSLSFLQDMSMTIMSHLEGCKVKEQYRRGEQIVRGLGSFIQGLSALKGYESDDARFWTDEAGDNEDAEQSSDNLGSSLGNFKQNPNSEEALAVQPNALGPDVRHTELPTNRPTRQNSDKVDKQPEQLQHTAEETNRVSANSRDAGHSLLPTGSAKLFSRAANIIRQSSNFDGVLFFDASLVVMNSVDRNPHSRRSHEHQPSHATTSTTSLSSTYSGESSTDTNYLSQSDDHSAPSDKEKHDKHDQGDCSLLGFSMAHISSTSADTPTQNLVTLSRRELRRLVQKHPHGKIFNISEQGGLSLSDESGSDATITPLDDPVTRKVTKDKHRPAKTRLSEFETIMALAPRARSMVALPLWDFERERWSAVCVCWTESMNFNLTASHDLLYLKVFGNSLMNGISKLDAIATDRAKTTFVASISHELRSPLHGILGGVEFLQDTVIDNFQVTMLSSIESCGRTMLDTVDHVLEFAKINDFMRSKSSKRSKAKSSHHMTFNSSPQKPGISGLSPLVSDVDLAMLTEEVSEAIYSSTIYKQQSTTSDVPRHGDPLGLSQTTGMSRAAGTGTEMAPPSSVRVFLRIPFRENWTYNLQPGAWRRIVMNILGNALKYTQSGLICVALDASNAKSSEDSCKTTVSLTIKDTGQGISPKYLQSGLFSPFSQENPFSSGTGLGLSIVRQLVQSLPGIIDVKSVLGMGTQVKITFNATRTPTHAEPAHLSPQDSPAAVALQLRDRTIGIVERPLEKANVERLPLAMRSAIEQDSSLTSVFTEWFGLSVASSQKIADIQGDLVVWVEPTVEQLTVLSTMNNIPDLLIVCRSTIDAFKAIRKASERTSGYVDVIVQPCGPHKVAKALHHWFLSMQSRPPSKDVAHSALQNTVPRLLWKTTSINNDNGITELARRPQPPAKQVTKATSFPNLSPRSTSLQTKPVYGDGSSASPEERLKVLIVDDSPINLRLVAVYMRKRAFDYVEATDGLQAFETYKRESRKFNYVLMDISMPVMDGLESSRAIRGYEKEAKLPATTIIAMTGLASAQAQADASKSGIDHYFIKPVRFTDLESLIK